MPGETIPQSPTPLETLREQFSVLGDQLQEGVTVLRTNLDNFATIIVQEADQRLIIHEESTYTPDDEEIGRRSRDINQDQAADTPPFHTYGQWWFIDVSKGIYSVADFDKTEGSIQGIVFALEAYYWGGDLKSEYYEQYIRELVLDKKEYNDPFEDASPIDQALVDRIDLNKVDKPRKLRGFVP